MNGKDYLTVSDVTSISEATNNSVVVMLSGSNEQATLDFTESPNSGNGQIFGRVFLDSQQDGELEEAELDKPLANVQMTLVAPIFTVA